MLEDRSQSFGRLEQEFRQERAAALGRIGRTLDTLLAQLGHLRVESERTSGSARATVVAEYEEARRRSADTFRPAPLFNSLDAAVARMPGFWIPHAKPFGLRNVLLRDSGHPPPGSR